MTLYEQVNALYIAVYRSRGVKPRGLVLGEDIYRELLKEAPWKSHLQTAEYQQEPANGDTYRGLEVSVSRRKDTITVY